MDCVDGCGPVRRATGRGRLDASGAYGLKDLVPQFDTLLSQANPHYKYANSLAHGISVMEVDEDEVRVSFIVIKDVKNATFDGNVERVNFRTAAGTNTVEKV